MGRIVTMPYWLWGPNLCPEPHPSHLAPRIRALAVAGFESAKLKGRVVVVSRLDDDYCGFARASARALSLERRFDGDSAYPFHKLPCWLAMSTASQLSGEGECQLKGSAYCTLGSTRLCS